MTEKSENFGKKPVRRSKSEESEPAKVYRPRTMKWSGSSKTEDPERPSAPEPKELKAQRPTEVPKPWDKPEGPTEKPRRVNQPAEDSGDKYPSPRGNNKFSETKEFKLKKDGGNPESDDNPAGEEYNYASSRKKVFDPRDLDPEVTRKPSYRGDDAREKGPGKGRYGDRERYGAKEHSSDSRKGSSDKPGRFDRSEKPSHERDNEASKPYGKPRPLSGTDTPERNSYKKSASEKPRSYGADRPYKSREDSKGNGYKGKRSEDADTKPRRSFDKSRNDSDKPRRDIDKPWSDSGRPKRDFDKPHSDSDRPRRNFDKPRSDSDRPNRTFDKQSANFDRPFRDKGNDLRKRRPAAEGDFPEKEAKHRDIGFRKAKGTLRSAPQMDANIKTDKDGMIRLNKYISNSGLCSRREADEYIAKGMITVNGAVVNILGAKVNPTDEIRYKDNKLDPEHKVYILLNKPKDYVTTVEDPNVKYTVMDLIEGACDQRVYPVGRLDRNSTGLLLLTNDGELTTKLTHPSFEKKKVYEVGLDRNLNPADLDKLIKGVVLDDGVTVHADTVAYINEGDKSDIGIEIHSGQNRVVRRMFESLDYKVTKLDRVYFAGLTKKNLPRGKWRFLDEKEIRMLKLNRFE